MRTVLLILALAVALVPASAAAAATKPGRSVGQIPGSAYGDGHRWFAWSDDELVDVLDADTGRRAEYVAPEDCALTDVGRGQALFTCGGYGSTAPPRLMNLADGTLHEPANVEAITPTTPGTFAFVAVGRYGLQGRAIGPHRPPPVLWNWRTGERIRRPTYHDIVNLDRPEVVQPMCAPLVRGLNDTSWYDRPWLATGGIHRIRLMHCGRARYETIRCRPCHPSGIFGGVLTWQDGNATLARDLRTGRRWRFPGYPYVARVGRTLLLSPGRPGDSRIVRLPR